MAKLEDQQRTVLRDKQRAWIKEKDVKCMNASAEDKGGTLERIVVSECFLSMTDERVQFLENYVP